LTRIEPVDRPTASGHRFGPDLACSECGIHWDEHQRDPHPCRTQPSVGAFERRPNGQGDDPAASELATKVVTTTEPPSTSDAASVPPIVSTPSDEERPGGERD
jgi:hypothetical protein